jgi:hypothetical protein
MKRDREIKAGLIGSLVFLAISLAGVAWLGVAGYLLALFALLVLVFFIRHPFLTIAALFFGLQ